MTTKNGRCGWPAIHEFLRFQIDDHHTGDNTEVHP